jgi:hypothetical protein
MKWVSRKWLRFRLVRLLIRCESEGIVRYESKIRAWRVLS